MTLSRFDFEQQIMDCWSVVDDIKTLRKMHDIRSVSEDELDNSLLGIQTLYQMKFEQLFDTFEKLVHEGRVK